MNGSGRARRVLPWLGVGASAVAAIIGVASIFVAQSTESTAVGARDGAYRLLQARAAVAKAQEQLGDTDLEDALASARAANATAQRVGRTTRRIVALLTPTERTAASAQLSASRGVRSAALARRQTEIAARVLGAIAGYQGAATTEARRTNSALRRILAALEKTNENWPPRPVGP